MKTLTPIFKYWFLFSTVCLVYHNILIYSNAAKVSLWPFATMHLAIPLYFLLFWLPKKLVGTIPKKFFINKVLSPPGIWIFYIGLLGAIAGIIIEVVDEDEGYMNTVYDLWDKYSPILNSFIIILLIVNFIILKRDKFTYHERSSAHPFYNIYISTVENFIMPFYAFCLFVYTAVLTYYSLSKDSEVDEALATNSYSSSFMIICNTIIICYMTGFGVDQGLKLANKMWETKKLHYRPVL